MGLAISPDESTIATCGEHEEIYLWDISTGRLISTFKDPNGDSTIKSILYT